MNDIEKRLAESQLNSIVSYENTPHIHEMWHVRIHDDKYVVKIRIVGITDLTVSFRNLGPFNTTRTLKLNEVEFIEKTNRV